MSAVMRAAVLCVIMGTATGTGRRRRRRPAEISCRPRTRPLAALFVPHAPAHLRSTLPAVGYHVHNTGPSRGYARAWALRLPGEVAGALARGAAHTLTSHA